VVVGGGGGQRALAWVGILLDYDPMIWICSAAAKASWYRISVVIWGWTSRPLKPFNTRDRYTVKFKTFTTTQNTAQNWSQKHKKCGVWEL